MTQPEPRDERTVLEGSQELSPALPPLQSGSDTGEEGASPATPPAPTAVIPPAAKTPRHSLQWESPQWAQTGRAVLLFGLLGMAVVAWFRLTRERFTTELLAKNTLDLPIRDVMLAQILGTGLVLGLIVLLLCMFWRWSGDPTRMFETWGWFLSPLTLLPAIPVVSEVDVW